VLYGCVENLNAFYCTAPNPISGMYAQRPQHIAAAHNDRPFTVEQSTSFKSTSPRPTAIAVASMWLPVASVSLSESVWLCSKKENGSSYQQQSRWWYSPWQTLGMHWPWYRRVKRWTRIRVAIGIRHRSAYRYDCTIFLVVLKLQAVRARTCRVRSWS